MKPVIQVSIDVDNIEEALEIAEVAVKAGVDILEAGTPLILGEGVRAVKMLRERFPDYPIVADIKAMDGGYAEGAMMAEAGATYVTVMAQAHPATVKGFVQAGKDYGIKIMADLMMRKDKAAAAKEMEDLGVDYIVLHTGFDERHEELGKSPLDDLEAVRKAVSIPIQAVGGLSIEQAIKATKLGAPMLVIGAPIAMSDTSLHASAGLEELSKILCHVVKEIKGE